MKLSIYTVILAVSICSALQAQNDLSYYEAIVPPDNQGVSPSELSKLEHEAIKQPMSPDSYYPLSKAFSETSERVWAVVYGEIYCNLTTDAPTFLEISKLLGSMFERSLTYKGDGNVAISFMAVSGVDKDTPTVPFEMSFELSTIHSFTDFEQFRNITLATIHQVRMNQVRAWKEKELTEHGLINWHTELSQSGLFEAYNYWLFQNFRPDEYAAWKSRNKHKLSKFLKWRQTHKIDPTKGSWHRVRTTNSDAHWKQMVSDGETLLAKKQPKEAIENYFDPVIKQFNALRSETPAQIYCARDSKESLVYLIQAAVMEEKENGTDVPEIWGNQFGKKKDGAEVLSQFWAEAFYLKSYALVELGQPDQAEEMAKTAVGLSPMNFNYLAELGHIYQLEKNWDMALPAFKASVEAATFSHPDSQDAHRARAWRGIGYVYVEQGKLKEAKAMYKKCLELNPNDKSALAEIKYIEKLQAE